MKADDLIEAFGDIDPKYVTDAEMQVKSKRQIKKMLFGVREKFALEKEQPAYVTVGAALCMSAVALIVCAGMFYGRIRDGYSGDAMESASATSDENMAGNISDGVSDEAELYLEGEEEDTSLIFNDISEVKSIVYDMEEPYKIASYNAAELEEYFGTKICPASIPEDLELSGDKDAYHVGYDEDGNVVDDNNELIYSDESGKRTLKIGVRTTESGIVTRFADENLTTSVMNAITVTAGRYRTGQAGAENYIAIFEREGIIFTIESFGLTEKEFTTVIEELVH